MSRQEPEPPTRARARANTTSTFVSFPWRKRTEPAISPTSPPAAQQSLSLEGLIHALSPPAVPSLAHARSLASTLSNCSPLPRHDVLNPLLDSLCDSTRSPPLIQAAGYDILSAYWENHESLSLGIAERLSYFSLFLGGSTSWGMELWEPKFKALRALTRYGTEIMGIEHVLIKLLHDWIEGAFEGLLVSPTSNDRAETKERERSVDLLVKFLGEILTNQENISRIPDEEMAGVLNFYAGLVDRAIALPDINKESRPPTSPISNASSSTSNPRQPQAGHRRNLSSLSSSSIPPLVSNPPPPQPAFKHPAELAITLYLNHLSTHIKTLPPTQLGAILPLLFRAISFCGDPLPRLSVLQARKEDNLEYKITERLTSLFSGPYATMCMVVLKAYLFPPAKLDAEPISRSNQQSQVQIFRASIMTRLGAHRTFRNYVRRALLARIARALISRDTSIGYNHSGAPGNMELHVDLMEKAWPKDDFTAAAMGVGGNGWNAARLGMVLADSVKAWVDYRVEDLIARTEAEKKQIWQRGTEGKDEILEEAAGVIKDILSELDLRDDENGSLDEEEATIIGETLRKLSDYVLPLKNVDGTPFTIPIGHPSDAPTPILRTISTLLSRDHSRALNPLLSAILIHVAEHLTDEDTARLPILMTDQNDLSPISPEWLAHWKRLLGNETLVSPDRPQTRRAIMDTLHAVYEGVKDMTAYRRPLGDLVWEFCGGLVGYSGGQSDDADIMWKMIGEEIVLRSDEQDVDDAEGAEAITKFLELLVSVASEKPQDDDESLDTASSYTADTHSPATITATGHLSSAPSATRTHSEMPSVMSLLSSLATGGSTSRSQSVQPQPQAQEEVKEESHSPSPSTPMSNLVPRDVSAISALVEIFSQLVFTPFSLQHKNLLLALRVYHMLLSVVTDGQSVRARLTALQFLMRIRADRDHSLYFVSTDYDPNGLVTSLGALINRTGTELRSGAQRGSEDAGTLEASDIRRARARFPQERDGRQVSRGRGVTVHSRSEPSRSRSRTAPPPPPVRHLESLWSIPETMPFNVYGPDSPSEVLVSYDPEGPDRILVLPISQYLLTIDGILEKETSWEILSYVLCHLPVQLSNKHLFCGPKSRAAISKMHSILCTGILNGELGSYIEQWSVGLKSRDAHGLAYQTLSVLVSYRRCFDLQQRHLLVEVLQAGLNGQLATIKCCLHALSLSAFELQPSMTRCLSRILEKLSQIMSNPNMAVHILGFLSIIGSLPSLYANFTERDFKMVFGVALQYLQHYNQLNSSPTMSWALSQHVRVLSYSAVYIWFLAVKLPDRPQHVRYITRQLLLANEGNSEVDAPTEVCFDWLARYTYASADPRPASSVFSDIVLNPSKSTSDMGGNEKTWIMGNSVVTIRALPRSGWVEVLSRRPSGFSRFVCRVENVPMVGPGDVEPDLLSIPAGLIMERDPSQLSTQGDSPGTNESSKTRVSTLSDTGEAGGDDIPQPDPITGYVWSGTAPSQRRKQIGIDPSFLILQLTPFPDGKTEPFAKRVTDATAISKFVSSLDRIPVIDTHKVGIMYVAPGQSDEIDILRNVHGSPAYTRFLEGIGRLINLRGQMDVYAGGLDPEEDGEYAYAWWDDIGQILYHTATMMPTNAHDPQCTNKKRHIGNDYVRIVWNDSALPYRFDTLKTQFQFVNIVIEPHSVGSIAAFSISTHETEYFKVTIQLAPGMTEFAPVGHFKLISSENLPLLVRQLSLLADWFATIFAETQRDTVRVETKTNWHGRLDAIRRFKNHLPPPDDDTLADSVDGVMGQESLRDFTTTF
ncbi:hypothetical protein CVT25_013084 [Psilocybe cyanescens]|uniref:Rap-GAP domain-containing protein n=1 Tax=Psilocybe cyanescens TaxID=93625 RepID=A0A409XHN2_PSICY|nr:hypothetical protein CVT25_013084 [Psilocybe cyanescens]